MPQRLADMKASVDAWVGDGVEQQPEQKPVRMNTVQRALEAS